ncbi:MAG: adenosylhomocysteinase, partial [Serratia liquefaciens]|nr:adenosylhomocysteinase [Serratia liquefaciens]
GAKNVLSAQHLQQVKDGVFILNVGHVTAEIDVGFLQNLPHSEPMPFVNAYQLGDKQVYLLANGSMFNLTAGYGDSLNAFDVTLAVMAAGIGHIVGDGSHQAPGLYLLPQSAWQPAL